MHQIDIPARSSILLGLAPWRLPPPRQTTLCRRMTCGVMTAPQRREELDISSFTTHCLLRPLTLCTCHRDHPVNWENPTHALAQREPRRGCRAVLAATVHVPQGPLLVYNLHLEVRQGKIC